MRNKTYNRHRKTARKERQRKTYECNKQYIKNLSNIQLTKETTENSVVSLTSTKENSFQFDGKNHLQIHGTCYGN